MVKGIVAATRFWLNSSVRDQHDGHGLSISVATCCNYHSLYEGDLRYGRLRN